MIDEIKKYWDNRYKYGGNSGQGSYGSEAEIKVDAISKLAGTGIRSILDIGCGDFNIGKQIVSALEEPLYLGVDVSGEIVDRNRKEYGNQFIKFLEANEKYMSLGIEADLVLCIDVLFHQTDDEEYEKLTTFLKKSFKRFLVLSNIEGYGETQTANHVKIRPIVPEDFGEMIAKIDISNNGAEKYLYIIKK